MNCFGTLHRHFHGAARRFVLPLTGCMFASHIGKRLATGTFWSLVAGAVSRFMALLGSIIIARLLGQEAFGELGILQSTLEMFASVSAFGMGLTSTKYIAEFRHSDPDKAGRIIAMSRLVAWTTGAIGALGLIWLAPVLASGLLAAPHLTPLLKVTSISVLFGALNGAQLGGLAGFEAFKQVARINIISGILTIVLRVVGTLVAGLSGAVLAMVLAQMTGSILNFVVLRRVAATLNISIRYSHCFRELPVFWRFSLPSVLSSLVALPSHWLCYSMLVRQPDGYLEMALFNAANQWFSLVLFIPGLVGQAVLPVLLERVAARDFSSARHVFWTMTKTNAAVFLPVALLAGFSKQVMGAYGNEFAGGWITLMIILLTAGLQAVQIPAGHMLVSSGRMWLALIMNLAWAATFVGATVLMVAAGSSGLATARLLALGLHCVWTFAFAWHALRTMSAHDRRVQPLHAPHAIEARLGSNTMSPKTSACQR